MTEERSWGADVPSEDSSFNGGSNDITIHGYPPSLASSPRPATPPLTEVLHELALAMREQNQALWALVHQTAALIEMQVETAPSEDASPTHYLDGTLINGGSL